MESREQSVVPITSHRKSAPTHRSFIWGHKPPTVKSALEAERHS